MYWRTRLLSKDNSGRTDITYLLHSAVSYDMMLLKSILNSHMQIHKQSNTDLTSFDPLTACDIVNPNFQTQFFIYLAYKCASEEFYASGSCWMFSETIQCLINSARIPLYIIRQIASHF